MVSFEDSYSRPNHHFLLHTRNFYSHFSTQIHCQTGCTMCIFCSNMYHDDHTRTIFAAKSLPFIFENLTDSVVDMRHVKLTLRTRNTTTKFASSDEEYLQPSQAINDFFAYSNDISR